MRYYDSLGFILTKYIILGEILYFVKSMIALQHSKPYLFRDLDRNQACVLDNKLSRFLLGLYKAIK